MAKINQYLENLVQKLWDDKPIPDDILPTIERLISETYIERDVMVLIHEWLDSQRLFRKSGRVVAPPGTGKSVTCEGYYLLNKPQKRIGRRDIYPVLYLEATPDCSIMDLLVLIIQALGGDAVGQTTYLRKRALDLLKASKVEMLIFDEANLMAVSALGELARIYNQLKIAIILVGTQDLDTLVKKKPYIHDRFKRCYRFKALNEKEFMQTLDDLEENVLQLPVPSNLVNQLNIKDFWAKTGGKIRHLDSVLREAALFSLSQNHNKVDKQILEEMLDRLD